MRSTTVFGVKQNKGDKTMPDEQLEEWVVTKGVTEIWLVNAKDAKDAEEAAFTDKGVLIQRKTSTNAQPKPQPQPQQTQTEDTQGPVATHANLQAAMARLNTSQAKSNV